MNNTNYRQIIDLIKYPIITDKATRLLELNQYTFATDLRANKDQIKSVQLINNKLLVIQKV